MHPKCNSIKNIAEKRGRDEKQSKVFKACFQYVSYACFAVGVVHGVFLFFVFFERLQYSILFCFLLKIFTKIFRKIEFFSCASRKNLLQ